MLKMRGGDAQSSAEYSQKKGGCCRSRSVTSSFLYGIYVYTKDCATGNAGKTKNLRVVWREQSHLAIKTLTHAYNTPVGSTLFRIQAAMHIEKN